MARHGSNMRRRKGGETWFFQIKVPVDLIAAYHGKRVIERSMKTQNKDEACDIRDELRIQYKAEFDRLRKGNTTAELEVVAREHAAMLNAYDVLRRNPSFVNMAGTGFLFRDRRGF